MGVEPSGPKVPTGMSSCARSGEAGRPAVARGGFSGSAQRASEIFCEKKMPHPEDRKQLQMMRAGNHQPYVHGCYLCCLHARWMDENATNVCRSPSISGLRPLHQKSTCMKKSTLQHCSAT